VKIAELLRRLFQKNKLFMYLFWVWLILLLVVSSIPSLPVPEEKVLGNIRSDYLMHLIEYFVLASLFVLWKKQTSYKPVSLLIIWLIGSAVATVDEVHQLWIPDRSFNPIDLVYNSFGLLLGLLLTNILLISIYRENEESG
jgi:VanZ family protein